MTLFVVAQAVTRSRRIIGVSDQIRFMFHLLLANERISSSFSLLNSWQHSVDFELTDVPLDVPSLPVPSFVHMPP